MAVNIDEIEKKNKERTMPESKLVELGFKHVEGSDKESMSDGKVIYYFAMEINGVRMYRPPYNQQT
jgi:hypothetical protein